MKTTTAFCLALLGSFGLLASQSHAQTAPTWAGVQRSIAPDFAYGSGIAVAADGSQYVTGTFSSSITLGGITLTAGGGATHQFLARYSAAGTVLWATQIDAGQGPLSGHVAVDATGNVYLTGTFTSFASIGSTVLVSAAADAYLVKYDAQGTQQWARQAGGTGATTGGIAIDASGNVAIAGNSQTAVAFGGPALSSGGVFYYRFSPAGAVLQGTVIGTNGTPHSLALDGAGNAYVAGDFTNTATFGPTTLTSAGGSDVYLCKLSPAGTPLWAYRDGGPNYDLAEGVAVDAAGNALVCGVWDQVLNGIPEKAYLARFDPSGTPRWTRLVTTTGTGYRPCHAYGIAYDGRGGCFVTGQFAGTADFGTSSLTAVGLQLFVARYDAQGSAVWTDRTVGTAVFNDTAAGLGLATDATGQAFLTGSFGGTVAFGPFSATSAGNDAFVAKLTPGGVITAARPAALGVALQAYPNPATGAATLLLPAGGGHLQVRDALGRVVRTQALPAAADAHLVSLLGLAPGCYQLRATLGNGQVARTTLAVE